MAVFDSFISRGALMRVTRAALAIMKQGKTGCLLS